MEQFTLKILNGMTSNDGKLAYFNEFFLVDEYGYCHKSKLESGYLVCEYEIDSDNDWVLTELQQRKKYFRNLEAIQKEFGTQFDFELKEG